MPWIVGIDEAGYGPNLGPFVMSSVACRVPPALADANLWQALPDAVRRRADRKKKDDRLLIDDSKLVYSPARGLLDLETSLWAALALPPAPTTVADFLARHDPRFHEDLAAEPWYAPATPLPLAADLPPVGLAAERFRAACQARDVGLGPVCTVVVCPRRFNDYLDRHDSKAAVLAIALAELLLANQRLCPDDALLFFIDKHGGRNSYAALLQPAFADGVVLANEEGNDRSVYRLQGAKRAMQVTFQPRADADHLCVALASMFSKYLREMFMAQFNAYWRQHVPELKPTAGYPVDALRFLADIQPALARLGHAEATIWRRK